ncbi:MAG: LysR substrate-binding domain-containing protein [Bilophila wadsworthia]
MAFASFERANNGVGDVEEKSFIAGPSTSFKNSEAQPTSPPCKLEKAAPHRFSGRHGICSGSLSNTPAAPASTSRFRNRLPVEPMVLSGIDLAVTFSLSANFSWLQIGRTAHVIMPPDHPLADRKRLKMDELADNAFIGFEQGFLLNDRIKAVCRQRGLKLNECLRSGQLDFIMTLVATGIGVALLPRLELERRELPNIHIALLDEEELRWRAAFVWRRGAVLSSAAQAWLKLLPGGEEALASERLA